MWLSLISKFCFDFDVLVQNNNITSVKMVSEDTLQIKNFPPELTDAEKEEFLLHFGATNVRVITSKTKQNSVSYARFKSKEIARNVMCSLHQIRVLNHYLSVKYAEHGGLVESLPDPKCASSLAIGTLASTDDENKKHYKTFVNRMHAFNRWVGFNQPTPSHLKYSYPGPNRATINNIAHALASVPKFYTQVLHIMNRMNFPPPFANEAPPPTLHHPPPPINNHSVHAVLPQPPLPPKLHGSDEESEMESDPDSPRRPKEIIASILKRTHNQPEVVAKLVKRPKLTIQPLNDAKIIQNIEMAQKQKSASCNPDDIFERVEAIQPAVKRIELKLTTDNLDKFAMLQRQEEQPSRIMKCEQKGLIDLQLSADNLDKMAQAMEANMEEEEVAMEEMEDAVNDMLEGVQEQVEEEEEEDLMRLTPDEIAELAVFKNYQAGAPTAKLYIKNICKTVDNARLERLYRRYNTDTNTAEEPVFDVRLMQEGRMKGQAFITFSSIAAAERALIETNGIVLDDKPLVVVFGKVPPPTAAAKKMVITPIIEGNS